MATLSDTLIGLLDSSLYLKRSQVEKGSQSRFEEVLAVGSLPWPTVRSILYSVIDSQAREWEFLALLITIDDQVGEWGGGDCGPVLIGGEGGLLTVVTLLRQ